MMKSYVRYMVALALVASAPVAAQTGGTGNDTPRAGRWQQGREARPPFQRLVALRQELQLTDAQVARIQEIGQRLQQRNAPLRAQLATQSEQFKAQRRAQMERLSPEARRDTLRSLRQDGRRRRQVPESMRVPMQQMRENTRAAMDEVQTVLTPQQKERARALMRQERGRRGEEGRRGQAGRRGGRQERAQPGTGTVRS